MKLAVCSTLLLGVVGSGLLAVDAANEVRVLHGRLQQAADRQDQEVVAYSRLLLERGALTAYQNVERIAVVELKMQFPDTISEVDP